MTPTEKLIRIAAAEVGYIGHGSRSDLDNPAGDGKAKYTKYARDLDAVGYFNGKKQGFDWCAVFVAWCFFKGWGKELSQKLLTYPPKSCGAGVKWVYSYGKRAGRIVNTPNPGDIMILKTEDGKGWRHVAIVETVGEDMIHTLEGNSDNRVRRWTYAPNEKRIAGYLRPRWDLADVEPERYTVKKGDSLWKISKMYYGTGWKYTIIAKENGIKGNLILPGQVLIIPDIAGGDLADVEPERYTVKKGDSLWKISKLYYGTGWKYTIIAKENGIKGNLILPGQVLIIPDID